MIPIITHKAKFSRLRENSLNKEIWEDFLYGIPCNIQPAGNNPSERATGIFEKTHLMFIPSLYSGIREGQRVTISGMYNNALNKTFQVVGLSDWSNDLLPHFELRLSENLG